MQEAEKKKAYEDLEQQLKVLVKNYGEATEQLNLLRESVNESKNLLKANIEKEENEDLKELREKEDEKIDQEKFELFVDIQKILQQSDIRDEELSSLESIVGM